VSRAIVECVPNFSEGRDSGVIDAIVEAIAAAGAAVLHRTSDPDHNRSVVTFAGAPERVADAAFRAVAQAAARIDLRRHAGVHPRIGATDVVPFVPVSGIGLEDCAALAAEVGRRIWEELGVPVYLYEAAARRPDRRNLADIRRGGFEGLREAVRTDPARLPDFGGPELHPSAGATVVGARKFLVAFNVNLATADVEAARRIARKERASSGGLPCVKAIGLPLASHGLAQVSMNLTDFEVTGVGRAFAAVRDEAAREGVAVAGSELIGLAPRAAFEEAAASLLALGGFHRGMVLENRIEAALPDRPLDALLAGLAGGGEAAAAAGAMAAALAHSVWPDREGFALRRGFFASSATADQEAWRAYTEATADAAETLLHEAARIPLEVAEEAAWLKAELAALSAPEPYAAEAATAAALAQAALTGATAVVRANLKLMRDVEMARAIEERLEGLR
jgi:glutamate formiminotransferase